MSFIINKSCRSFYDQIYYEILTNIMKYSFKDGPFNELLQQVAKSGPDSRVYNRPLPTGQRGQESDLRTCDSGGADIKKEKLRGISKTVCFHQDVRFNLTCKLKQAGDCPRLHLDINIKEQAIKCDSAKSAFDKCRDAKAGGKGTANTG